MLWIAISFVVIYAFTIGLITYGWFRMPLATGSSQTNNPKVTVLIAFRNEEGQLSNLLADLQNQEYPTDAMQIVLINDHSTDEGGAIVAERIEQLPHIELHHLPEDLSGKKAALQYGLEKAKGAYIVTTDADCHLPPRWISSLVACQQNTQAQIVCGPVVIKPTNSFWPCFEAFEFMSLNASGAGAIGLNRPFLSNAANTLYTKEVFDKLQSSIRQDLPSGDDIFLLLAQKKDNPSAIAFAKDKAALVTTAPQKSLSTFIAQRRRWTSKSVHYHDFDILWVAFVITLFNLAFVFSLFGGLWHRPFWEATMLLYLAKTIIDLPLLWSAARFYKNQKCLPAVLVFQLLYPIYITFTVASGFIGKISWKNRHYTTSK